MRKEKQEFQLGDIAYLVDEDYSWWESEVFRIELTREGTYLYETRDVDFTAKDINDWVYKSEQNREILQLLK